MQMGVMVLTVLVAIVTAREERRAQWGWGVGFQEKKIGGDMPISISHKHFKNYFHAC